MSEAIEKLTSEIAQIKAAMESRKADPAVFDFDKITEAFKKALADHAESRADTAVRKGESIEPPIGALVKTGKFAGRKADEVIFARNLLMRAKAHNPGIKDPSRELEDAYQKALTATGVGTGDELVPTGMASNVWEDIRLAALVASNIQNVPMPTNPYEWPHDFGDATWRKGTQNTGTTASDPGTGKSVLTATENVVEVDLSYDLDEDAVISMIPELRKSLIVQGGEQLDRFIINADAQTAVSGNVNSDDAAPASDAYYLSDGQNGIRRQVLTDNTAQGASAGGNLTDALVRSTLAKMGKYAANPAECALVTDPRTYLSQFLGLTNVVTMDKYGPNATILTGELSRYSGVPIIVTGALDLYDTDGKYTTTTPAVNDVKGSFYVFRRRMWALGKRRDLTIEIDRDIKKRQLILVASFRVAVGARGTRASNTHTAGLYNITV